MNFLRRLFARAGIPLSAVTPKFFGVVGSDAGESVTPWTAMGVSAVFACVNVIASAIASLPASVVRKRDGKVMEDHPVAAVLDFEPNEDQTPAVFREQLMVDLLLRGNAYAYIDKLPDGSVKALYPLLASQTQPWRMPGGGPLVYKTTIGAHYFELRPDQVLHVPDITLDGVTGQSRLTMARNPVGLAIAMERFAGKFFANGANLGGILELPAGMKPEAIEAFVESWKANYSGAQNSLKTAMLTDGMRYTRTGTEPVKSQMLESRVFQVREIARIYRVPPHKIGDLERATFSNIEQQSLEFQQDTVSPWVVKWEQECNRKLYLMRERGKVQTRFDMDSLLRSDTAARYTAWGQALLNGWQTVNEIRKREGLPPVPDGDKLLQPLNMGSPGGDPAKEPPKPTAENKDNAPVP